MNEVRQAVAALQRAYSLAIDLDRTMRSGDLAQVKAGVLHELETALRLLQPPDIADRAETPVGPAEEREWAYEARESTMLLYIVQCNQEDVFPTDLALQRVTGASPQQQRMTRYQLGLRGLIQPAGVTTEEGENWTQWQATAPGRELARKLSGEGSGAEQGSRAGQTTIMDL